MEVKMLLLKEEETYSIRDVLEMFPIYFGMNVEEWKVLLGNYEVLSEEVIQEYLIHCPEKMWENRFQMNDMKEIIGERMKDYQIFKKNLEILSRKALLYLNFLTNMDGCHDGFRYEEEFNESMLGIVVSKNGMIGGYEFNQILIPIYHSIYQFLSILNQINCLETYHKQTYDSFARCYGEDKIYFTENALLTDSYILDKTSIYVRRAKYLGRK